jgi:uncharacterized protein YqiB (DUF1249 family)
MALINPIDKSYCLEQVCASNYRKLFRLIPDLLSYHNNAAGYAANHSTLYFELVDRSPYTLTIQLSHCFQKNIEEFLEPAVKVRLYLDVSLAEVISDHSRAAVPEVFKDPGLSFEIMSYKWRLNYFMHKWLDHCLNKGYRFVSESYETTVVA